MTKPDTPRLGVVGAGTMGSGIALAALYAGLPVVLQDVDTDAQEKALDYIRTHLERKGLSEHEEGLSLTAALTDLSGVDFVVEAAPEDLGLKRDLFARLDEICPPPAVLTTNTSTLAVTAIAAATETPGRVAGMHFFNPAPVLPLVEVVRAARTTPETVAAVVALAERIGKTPVVTDDTPGFIVNRVARPFYGEALRMLGEGVATHEEIDWILEAAAQFPMGPFRLLDLIGIDVNYAATQSVFEQTFFEPRYRPHRIQRRMVQQNALGRKTGRGFYEYGEDGQPHDRPGAVDGERLEGVVRISPGSWAPGLAEMCRAAGYTVSETPSVEERTAVGFVVAGRAEGAREWLEGFDRDLGPEVPLLLQASDLTVGEAATWIGRAERLAGFDGLFLREGVPITLAPGPRLSGECRERVDAFARSLGQPPVWVSDSPALVAPRVVACLANEAAHAVQEGVADPDTIDRAMQLGVNYPRGPLGWSRALGARRVLAVLDHLWAEYREPRYRAATRLRQWAREETLDRRAPAGRREAA